MVAQLGDSYAYFHRKKCGNQDQLSSYIKVTEAITVKWFGGNR